MLTTMNHREMEYTIRKYWQTQGIKESCITNLFSEWSNPTEKDAAESLMAWLEKTQEEVFQEDLLLDYGADCLRLYLMFERTPEPDDTWLDTWEECNLEGCYKFLGKLRRMILVADYANGIGAYRQLDAQAIRNRLVMLQKEVMEQISKGNTMPNRHNAIAIVMEELKWLQKELKIGELVTRMHSHELEEAVPHTQKEEKQKTSLQERKRNEELDFVLQELLIIITPFAPIIAEHLWQSLQKKDKDFSILKVTWKMQEAKADMMQLPVQVNAKTKKVITIQAGETKEQIEECAKEEISRLLEGKEYQVIYVPQKIINFVITS